MKIDYTCLKEILIIMEEESSHQIWVSELMKKLPKVNEDKFIGHIKVLFDLGCVETASGQTGFSIALNGEIIFTNIPYRLTARGYEFLDILKNDTIIKKIKNFAVSNAWEIGKQMLINLAANQIS